MQLGLSYSRPKADYLDSLIKCPQKIKLLWAYVVNRVNFIKQNSYETQRLTTTRNFINRVNFIELNSYETQRLTTTNN